MSRQRLVIQSLAALIGFAILIGLGIWQLERREWKHALIARVAAAAATAPVSAPGPVAWDGLDLASLEYAPVTVHGHYLNDREVYVVHTLTEPRGPLGGVGFLVMTPFVTDGGWAVYVNRGFVPRDRKDPASRSAGEIAGETTVTGLLRAPSERSWFTPADNRSANEWFSRAPALYAAAYGAPAPQLAPYIIDAVADPSLPGGLPQGGETIVEFTDNHLQYALTWFGLAAALAGVYGAWLWRRRAQA
ncbi:MAG TPA: SURF1 family protein [Bauldia sp.]|nr:SURF1 family protein [Bauldia sp.]